MPPLWKQEQNFKKAEWKGRREREIANKKAKGKIQKDNEIKYETQVIVSVGGCIKHFAQ